ncbi:glutamyl-tRNA amidotransferase [Pseudomonas aeruginosa]|uniref:amidase family protein n=1 Tax=Pseudomonas aeruginosa TaxID=287 RepID=UPI00190C61E8|nr:amidase family protein [Pseudomonas aeruginosa]MBK3752839.1 glutamyl-tRNA amidotransferase [Pseudomonas aeruginosa]MBK3763077.1 glutamyl-tRNA amidotransferase [Pseudomonas aeruginosa]MBK3769617.1 glutamyl-tRNA amidotransferase [Pseudomonas aeruginosa]MBK3789805.1 glutamyl-tRNA amidotransferase [Pseudomonas aeruginosa]MBK3885851.1 glutamyl-tRNA amidotransferase [Pseudomonas aeruginosa]
MKTYDFQSSNAFAERFEIAPYTSGALDGLCFAVKDNIDIRDRFTSYGSKPWREAHPRAAYNAVCVEQLLMAGARCVGKTIADEFTYSLDGESYFYGTPVNPRAPDRIPGGSSSGSASAVACGLVDFALGTDCGGSIRIPASLCGVFGMRPSMHRISEAGVLPFAPSVSTVGVLAKNLPVLRQTMHVLLRSNDVALPPVKNIYLVKEAFALADPAIQDALSERIAHLNTFPNITVASISLHDITGLDVSLKSCNEDALRVLQTAEIANTIGGWIQESRPEQGPNFRAGYRNVEQFDRSTMSDALKLCEALFSRISAFTQQGDIFCYPTAPVLAPKKGTLTGSNLNSLLDYYDRTMAVTSFAGVARLPEITLPLAQVNGIPVGLSLAAGHYQDEFLLDASLRLWGSQPMGLDLCSTTT